MHDEKHYGRTGAVACAALAATMAIAPPAHAAPAERWYVGASADKTHVEVFRGFGWEIGGSQSGYSFHGGLEISRWFAVQFGALRATDLEWTEYLVDLQPGYPTSATRFDATALHASAIGKVGNEHFQGYLKFGLARYRVNGQQTLGGLRNAAAITRHAKSSGTDYLLGIGLGMKAAERWRVRLEYQYFGIEPSFLGTRSHDPSIDTLSIGVDYRLAGKRAAQAGAGASLR